MQEISQSDLLQKMDPQGSMERINEKDLLHLQSNLSLMLATTNDIDEGIRLCLEIAMQMAAMQSGIIFLFDRTKNIIIHCAHRGLDDNLLQSMAFFDATSKTDHAFHEFNNCQYPNNICDVMSKQFRSFIKLSIFNSEKLQGFMSLASNGTESIPLTVQVQLKTVAVSIQNVIARFIAHQELLNDKQEALHEIRRKEKSLELKNEKLKQLNTTLNTLLEKRENDRMELEQSLVYNIKATILPYIGQIRNSTSAAKRNRLLDMVEISLDDISSRFAHSLSTAELGLTPAEMKVAAFVKQGKSTKEIAELIGSSEKTIKNQRLAIRKKIRINNKKVNLRTYLQSLQL
jgi:DNA-binding CsgD family transcriptional regulator